MPNKGKKMKRFVVYVNSKKVGQEMAFSKTNAMKNVRKLYGKRASVRLRQIKW